VRRQHVPRRCRLFGHKPGLFGTRGNFDLIGQPRDNGMFTIDAWCDRCGTWVGVTSPSKFVFVREDEDG
jgi:hypothetical protein